MDTLAIDVGSKNVGLCRWNEEGLHLLKQPTESPADAWPRWIEALDPADPYQVIYRCTHSVFRNRHGPRTIATLADRHGARQLRTIAEDLHADPVSAAARYVARQHRLPIICCAEAGAATLTAVVQDPRGTVSAFRRFPIQSTNREALGEVSRWLRAALAAAEDSDAERTKAVPLICFGGWGPSIAAQLADDCGLASFLIPQHAGLFSTIGMFMSDIVLNFEQDMHATEVDLGQLRHAFRKLMDRASHAITMEGYDLDDAVCLRIAQMAHAGDDDSVEVDCDDMADASRLVAKFRAMRGAKAGSDESTRPIEVWAIRVKAVIETRTVDMLPAVSVLSPPGETTQPEHQRGFTPPADATIHARHELTVGSKIKGPACVCEPHATTVIPPNWVAECTATGSLLVQCLVRNAG